MLYFTSSTAHHPLRNTMNSWSCVRNRIISPQTTAASLYHDTTYNTENKTERMQFHDNLLEEYAWWIWRNLPLGPTGCTGMVHFIWIILSSALIHVGRQSDLRKSKCLSQHDVSVWTGVLLDTWSAISPFYITLVYINFQGNVKFAACKCKSRGKNFRIKLVEKADLRVNSTDSWFTQHGASEHSALAL